MVSAAVSGSHDAYLRSGTAGTGSSNLSSSHAVSSSANSAAANPFSLSPAVSLDTARKLIPSSLIRSNGPLPKNALENRRLAPRVASASSEGDRSEDSYAVIVRSAIPVISARAFLVRPRRRRARVRRSGLNGTTVYTARRWTGTSRSGCVSVRQLGSGPSRSIVGRIMRVSHSDAFSSSSTTRGRESSDRISFPASQNSRIHVIFPVGTGA